eukprot:Platyproteum_vivax@DN4768_c0_g1_i2.p1
MEPSDLHSVPKNDVTDLSKPPEVDITGQNGNRHPIEPPKMMPPHIYKDSPEPPPPPSPDGISTALLDELLMRGQISTQQHMEVAKPLVPQEERKVRWSPQEDQMLRDLVKLHGISRWALISKLLNDRVHGGKEGRTGRQCRERWCNHLDPDNRKGDWGPDEDETIITKQQEMGNRWAEIAKMLNGRTEHQVKNRYNSLVRKKIKMLSNQSPLSRHPPLAPGPLHGLSLPWSAPPYTAQHLLGLGAALANPFPVGPPMSSRNLSPSLHHMAGYGMDPMSGEKQPNYQSSNPQSYMPMIPPMGGQSGNYLAGYNYGVLPGVGSDVQLLSAGGHYSNPASMSSMSATVPNYNYPPSLPTHPQTLMDPGMQQALMGHSQQPPPTDQIALLNQPANAELLGDITPALKGKIDHLLSNDNSIMQTLRSTLRKTLNSQASATMKESDFPTLVTDAAAVAAAAAAASAASSGLTLGPSAGGEETVDDRYFLESAMAVLQSTQPSTIRDAKGSSIGQTSILIDTLMTLLQDSKSGSKDLINENGVLRRSQSAPARLGQSPTNKRPNQYIEGEEFFNDSKRQKTEEHGTELRLISDSDSLSPNLMNLPQLDVSMGQEADTAWTVSTDDVEKLIRLGMLVGKTTVDSVKKNISPPLPPPPNIALPRQPFSYNQDPYAMMHPNTSFVNSSFIGGQADQPPAV